MKKGTSAVLLQSGLDEKRWADLMECNCYLRNVQDFLADGKTSYERRFAEPFKGPKIPLGQRLNIIRFSARDQSRLHPFGKKFPPGIFLGYALVAGIIWKGDILVADIEENMNASEIHPRRIDAKEVLTPPRREYFKFTEANGAV